MSAGARGYKNDVVGLITPWLEYLTLGWIFSIDNEWIFVVIMKPGPDFGNRILRPELFSRRPLKDPGFGIRDSETFLVLQRLAL